MICLANGTRQNDSYYMPMTPIKWFDLYNDIGNSFKLCIHTWYKNLAHYQSIFILHLQSRFLHISNFIVILITFYKMKRYNICFYSCTSYCFGRTDYFFAKIVFIISCWEKCVSFFVTNLMSSFDKSPKTHNITIYYKLTKFYEYVLWVKFLPLS